jgi:protein-tyrosine-phosphatase
MKPTVLFMCIHNAGRSQMAAGWLRHLAGNEIEVLSGGSEPGSTLNQMAVAAMNEVGIDISNNVPTIWTTEIVQQADVVVSMGCGDVCPVFPGKRYEDWDLKDPAGQDLDFVRAVRDDIKNRVIDLMQSLQH